MSNKKKLIGIYRIFCKTNGKSYYGQTNDFERRMIEHRKHLRHHSRSKHCCVHLQNAWNLYGEDQFEFLFIEECPEDQLTIREQWYFDEYGPQGVLFNTALDAESPRRGAKLTQEQKDHLSRINSGANNPSWGVKRTDEVRKRISDSHKGEKHPQYGKPISEGVKKKISDSLSGENCHLAKLTWDNVTKIRHDFYDRKITVQEIVQQYNIEKTTIYSLLKNITWKDDLYDPTEVIKILEQGNKTLNKETVKLLREDYKTGKYEQAELGKKYGLTVSATGKTIRNEAWPDEEYAEWYNANKKPHKKCTRINMKIAQKIREDFHREYGSKDKEKGYIEIGKRYDLAGVTIRKIIKNKMWAAN